MIHFLIKTPDGISRKTADERQTILDALRGAGVLIDTDCNGAGKCGRCIVKAICMGEFLPSKPLEERILGNEMISDGFRLACQHAVIEGLELTIDLRADRDMLYKSDVKLPITVSDAVSPVEFIPFDDATFDELRKRDEGLEPDWAAILPDAVEQRFYEGNPQTSSASRGFAVTSGPKKEAVALVNLPFHPLGIAVDLGSTTIAVYLCELSGGVIRDVWTVRNPQWRYGSDVITRLTAAQDLDAASKMQRLVREAISESIEIICGRQGRKPADVLELVVVGNPTMMHILLGAPTRGLAFSPYRPVYREAIEVKARDLGLRTHPGAVAFMLPQPSAYIGGDALAAWLWLQDRIDRNEASLLLDLGTNGEMLLFAKGALCATSCATGPAFEGGGISSGMPGIKGAVDMVRLSDDGVTYHVIGLDDDPSAGPIGICGSGAISALAELLRKGWMSPDGRLTRTQSAAPPDAPQEKAFIIARGNPRTHGKPVTITQKDIRSLQLAKSAVATGVRFLCNQAGIEKPDRIYLAGAFGNVISPQDAITLGIVPPLDIRRIHGVGNAAGLGACKALLDVRCREKARTLHEEIMVIEMGTKKEFQDLFLENLGFQGVWS